MNKKQLQCYFCKGVYFRVICEKQVYDTVDVFGLKCVECGKEIKLQENTWLYGSVSANVIKSK